MKYVLYIVFNIDQESAINVCTLYIKFCCKPHTSTWIYHLRLCPKLHTIFIVILKSLRSVQISILEPKNYPQSSKNLGMLASKSVFSVRFGVAALPSLLPYR